MYSKFQLNSKWRVATIWTMKLEAERSLDYPISIIPLPSSKSEQVNTFFADMRSLIVTSNVLSCPIFYSVINIQNFIRFSYNRFHRSIFSICQYLFLIHKRTIYRINVLKNLTTASKGLHLSLSKRKNRLDV